jgi:hypothetical protein
MKIWWVITFGCAVLGARADIPERSLLSGDSCSPQWNGAVEAIVGTGDGHGHGPDAGSDEWRSVVEFKLGLRGNPTVPPRGDMAWCGYIDRLLRARSATGAGAPAFDCTRVRPDSAEALVCGDAELAALNRKLDET